MTRSVTTSCDRCGRNTDGEIQYLLNLEHNHQETAGNVVEFDLCGTCASGLRKYLGGIELIPRDGIPFAERVPDE